MSSQEGEINFKKTGVLVLRLVQIFTASLFISGFVWGSGDFLLTTVLVGSPMTPLSVLMMLYGFVGTIVVEVSIRVINRTGKN